jgi:DNA-binding MarR family transcriptional regulator
MTRTSKETTRQVLEVAPLIMRTIRIEMRRNGALDLSVPQFRALGFVERHPGSSLSDVAEHIGLTLPAMSKLIDGLVARKLVTRASQADDRRRMTLELTARGCALLRSAHAATHASLAERLAALSEDDHATVIRAMQILQPLFARNQVGECHDNS